MVSTSLSSIMKLWFKSFKQRRPCSTCQYTKVFKKERCWNWRRFSTFVSRPRNREQALKGRGRQSCFPERRRISLNPSFIKTDERIKAKPPFLLVCFSMKNDDKNSSFSLGAKKWKHFSIYQKKVLKKKLACSVSN